MSPSFSLPTAGVPFATLLTATEFSGVPWTAKIPAISTKAIRKFTAGPAPITTMRFHTGWRK